MTKREKHFVVKYVCISNSIHTYIHMLVGVYKEVLWRFFFFSPYKCCCRVCLLRWTLAHRHTHTYTGQRASLDCASKGVVCAGRTMWINLNVLVKVKIFRTLEKNTPIHSNAFCAWTFLFVFDCMYAWVCMCVCLPAFYL